MFARDKEPPVWPDLPPLHRESYERADLDPEKPLAPHADTAPGITPYLGLRARLSQVWLNRWTVLLLLVLVRVLLLVGGLRDDLDDAKAKALSACTKVEDVGSAMASMPHYLSVGVNALAAAGVNDAVDALVAVLLMILTGVEQLILFVINMWVGTYACLVAAFIHGGLDVGVSAVEGATDFMNKAVGSIADAIDDDVSKVQDAIDAAFRTISDVGGVFGAKPSPPTIDLSGPLDDLRNIKVDDTQFVQDLVRLNRTIPTFDQVQNLTRRAISFPFDLIKTQLNNSRAGWAFDPSVFPVAQKQALTFCSDNSGVSDFFQTLFDLVARAKVAFVVVLALLACAACVPAAYLEIRRWRRERRSAALLARHGYDPMDMVYLASRPHTGGLGVRLAARFFGGGSAAASSSPRRALLARWAVAYATSLPALFVLSLAVAGLVSCLCQLVLLRAVQQRAPALARQVGDFAGEVVTTLQNASARWADDANGVLDHFAAEVNDDVLAYVANATAAVNETLATFQREMDDALAAVFNGTVLFDVARDVVRCLVGLKIDAVEQGLTWVHDHARVALPHFPNDTFSRGAADSIHGDAELTSFLATPASVTTDEVTGAVDRVVAVLRDGAAQEAIVSTALLLVWVVVVLVGVCRSLVGMLTPDKTRGEGGQRYVTTDADAVAVAVADDPSAAAGGASRFASAAGGGGGTAKPRFPYSGGGPGSSSGVVGGGEKKRAWP